MQRMRAFTVGHRQQELPPRNVPVVAVPNLPPSRACSVAWSQEGWEWLPVKTQAYMQACPDVSPGFVSSPVGEHSEVAPENVAKLGL